MYVVVGVLLLWSSVLQEVARPRGRLQIIFRFLSTAFGFLLLLAKFLGRSRDSSVSSHLTHSLRSSSHLFLGLPTLLLVLVAEHRFGFKCCFLVNLSSLCEPNLMVNRNFSDVQRSHLLFGIPCAPFDLIDPILSFVTGFTHVVVSVVFERNAAVMVVSNTRACCLFVICHVFFFAGFFVLVCVFFVCTMGRSILRCAERLIFSCSSVPAPCNIDGVMTASNKRGLCRSR